MLKKKFWASFQRIIELLTQKCVTKLPKYGFGIRDPRSGIRKKPIPDPGSGSRGQKCTGSRILFRNTACNYFFVQFPGLVDILVGQLDSPWDNLRKATAHLFRHGNISFNN
jgi:hypothetical protein